MLKEREKMRGKRARNIFFIQKHNFIYTTKKLVTVKKDLKINLKRKQRLTKCS
jgi:hypothetical protein